MIEPLKYYVFLHFDVFNVVKVVHQLLTEKYSSSLCLVVDVLAENGRNSLNLPPP